MATQDTTTKSGTGPSSEDYEKEIRAEMAEIRKDIATLTSTLGKYGKARAEDLQDSASEMTDEMLEESRRAVKKLGKQVSRLEKEMETKVRENPLPWFLGAIGLGLVVAMMMGRNHD